MTRVEQSACEYYVSSVKSTVEKWFGEIQWGFNPIGRAFGSLFARHVGHGDFTAWNHNYYPPSRHEANTTHIWHTDICEDQYLCGF